MARASIASEVPLDAVLRAGIRRIFGAQPTPQSLEMDAACKAYVTTGQAARIVGVVREAIMNSLEYAHPTGIPGKIELSSAVQEDGTLRIQIADDGVGLPEGFDTERDGGSGFRTMRRASHELGASLSIESSSLGLVICLTLPCGTLPVAGSA